MKRSTRRSLGLLTALLGACTATTPSQPTTDSAAGDVAAQTALDLPVGRAPFDALQASWKQRLDQPYVYLEQRGDYRQAGRLIERLLEAADAASVEVQGPPFALYYDDPGRTAADELRMRACLPIAAPREFERDLRCDVLDSTTVVYAYVGGAYPEVPRAYPRLFEFMRELDWIEAGPIREVYLRDPAQVASWDELVTEVQIPAMRRP